MRQGGVITNKLVLSAIAILTTFLGFAGISVVVGLITGVRPEGVFQHNLQFVCMISLFQLGIVLSHPLNSRPRIMLRLLSVSALIIYATWFLSTKLMAIKLIGSNDCVGMTILAVLFALAVCVILYRKLIGRMGRAESGLKEAL